MSYLRFRLDLAVKQPIPQALQDKLPLIRQKIKELKAFASKITDSEDTLIAKYHICYHDEGKPCDGEIEI